MSLVRLTHLRVPAPCLPLPRGEGGGEGTFDATAHPMRHADPAVKLAAVPRALRTGLLTLICATVYGVALGAFVFTPFPWGLLWAFPVRGADGGDGALHPRPAALPIEAPSDGLVREVRLRPARHARPLPRVRHRTPGTLKPRS